MPKQGMHSIVYFRRRAYWLVALAILVGSGTAHPANLAVAATSVQFGAEQAPGMPPACQGTDDLLVSGETIVISGTEVLDHLCVTNKGKIVGYG